MDLHALTDFNLVASHGGFGRASRATGRPKATLSRKVTELEQSLGVRLIERGTHALRLTDEGQALHARTAGLLAEIAEAGQAVVSAASVPQGRLRVSAPVVLAHVALGRIAARFARAYPQVQLELVAEDRIVDPVEEGYDFVIRINPAPVDHLVGRRVLRDDLLLVAAPEVARTVFPVLSGDRTDVPAVLRAATAGEVVWRIVAEDGRVVSVAPRPVLRLSSLLMIHSAVREGAGVALLPGLLVARDVAAGRLVRYGAAAGPPVEIWALQSSRRLVGARAQAFLNVLEQELALWISGQPRAPDTVVEQIGAVP
ncbi:LysR family transcriptional regulator [Gluconacetobacter azotocaptans]|uniref:LysR family transcriptional regulator n=1 Tax=Gluconacetobacter azotocaptans TaxID=142834 RepID=A0A7W4PCH7_9PROT|nr:LysR substrate-binding domain-containing protein [Gluconacetobacter azotocaptans]MBB2188655.1 LysR family transcriptional regulator [Gluconacetobacter azotocaptans]MBM9400417.1 LysR family transcriptional regulator [Gluconacetobacter azotocaptans]